MTLAARQTETCPRCGNPFEPSRRWQRFCSADCREDWHSNRLAIVRPLAEVQSISEERLREAVAELLDKLSNSRK